MSLRPEVRKKRKAIENLLEDVLVKVVQSYDHKKYIGDLCNVTSNVQWIRRGLKNPEFFKWGSKNIYFSNNLKCHYLDLISTKISIFPMNTVPVSEVLPSCLSTTSFMIAN